MSKEYVKYIHKEFVDYMGKTHKFVVAGVSVMEPTTKDGDLISIEGDSDIEYDNGIFLSEYTPVKGLLIGVSVCSPKDSYDEKLGEKIAYSKATNVKELSSHTALYTTTPGLINDEVVTAILNNYADYISRNPGAVIKGYNEAEAKYQKKLAKQKFEESLPKEVQLIYQDIKNLDNKNLNLLVKALENNG